MASVCCLQFTSQIGYPMLFSSTTNLQEYTVSVSEPELCRFLGSSHLQGLQFTAV
uniref:Uncharacterized protein n=1 Tax=Arundo donax TaxID=35708 RepID=A0A0A9EGD4_ARUDO